MSERGANLRPDRHRSGSPAWWITRTREIAYWGGPGAVWSHILTHLGVQRYVWFRKDLSADEVEIQPCAALVFRFLDDTDEEDFLTFRSGATAELFRERFARGEAAFGVFDDAQLVGVSWVQHGPGPVYLRNPCAQISASEIYIHDAFVHPDYRGRDIIPASCSRIFHSYSARGYTGAITIVELRHESSLRAVAKAGFRHTAIVGSVKLGPWTWGFFRRDRGGATPEG